MRSSEALDSRYCNSALTTIPKTLSEAPKDVPQQCVPLSPEASSLSPVSMDLPILVYQRYTMLTFSLFGLFSFASVLKIPQCHIMYHNFIPLYRDYTLFIIYILFIHLLVNTQVYSN